MRLNAITSRWLGRSKSHLKHWLLLLLVSGCSNDGQLTTAETTPMGIDTDRQTAFRVRADFDAALNTDNGWAGAVNETAIVYADQPFRLRFEVESSANSEAERQYQVEVRRNQGEWLPLGAENFPQPAKVLELDFESEPAKPVSEMWEFVHGSDNQMNWSKDQSDGYLRVNTQDQPVLALGRYHTHWKAVEFAVDLRLSEKPNARAGIVFGYQDQNNYYRAEVDAADKVAVIKIDNGRELIITEHQADVTLGRWFELKLIMEGHHITVEYDDVLVFTQDLEQTIPASTVGLYVPEQSMADFQVFAIEGMPRSPRTSIIASANFAHGAATHDVLSVSEQPFSGGAGISFADATPVWSANGHSEWEFPIVIRHFADEAAMNEHGDQFEYRLVDSRGTPLTAAHSASVTLNVADGHLGGTFVETPMRIGPWEASNGDLYFLMEPSETWNKLMTVKSTDGGKSWREMDGKHRPDTGDLEGFASVLIDDKIHMLHQTSDDVWYHVFRTSDHPEQPDSWAIRDEHLASPVEPPTQVADIAVRSDDSVIAVYGGPEKIHYRVRSTEGQWSDETIIDADIAPNLSGPALVTAKNDSVHLAYTGDDGSAWYRRILPSGELTERVQFAANLGTGSEDIGSILPLVYLSAMDTVSIIYRSAEGILWERRVDAAGNWSEPVQVSERLVIQNAVDADQTGADAIAYGNSVHLLFIEQDTGRLFYTARDGDGDWSEAQRLVDDKNVQWVRGSLIKQSEQGATYGYVYDGGADGGSGMNQYGEVALQAP
ncbi:MAG TPA: hypothetical protein VIC08_15525 [Cellvibrionaceae bacterium]